MASDLEAKLGEHLRSRRIAARLTQAELARRSDVSPGAIQHLEQGAGSSTRSLVRVLRALGAEGWIDQLAPETEDFSPLELLEARQGRPRRVPRVRRVRHRRHPS